MDDLALRLLADSGHVSYARLSAESGQSCDRAKQVLAACRDANPDLPVWYSVGGRGGGAAGGRRVVLVPASRLSECLASMSTVTSLHVHSLGPHPPLGEILLGHSVVELSRKTARAVVADDLPPPPPSKRQKSSLLFG